MSIRRKRPASGWLDELNEQYFERLCGVARVRLSGVGRQHMAEDIVQEVLMIAHRREAELRKREDEVGGWLYKTTFNLCSNEIRKGSRQRRKEAFSVDQPEAPEIVDRLAEEQVYQCLECTCSYEEAIEYLRSQMKEAEYELFSERYIMARTTGELAEHYGISECAMGMRLLRLRRKAIGILDEFFREKC